MVWLGFNNFLCILLPTVNKFQIQKQKIKKMVKREIGRYFLTNCLSLLLCTWIKLDHFHISGKQDDLIEFWDIRFKGFNFDLSHISIILMETLSWPWALNAYYKTTNHWHATDQRQPTTDPSTGPKPPTDLRPLTHRPYENKPTDRQPTNYIRTNPHSIDPPAPNPPTGPQPT